MPNKEIGKLNVVVNLDSTGFQNGISQLNRQMKLVQSEFQLATAKLGNFGSSTDKLKLQADALTKQIEIQRQKVAALEAAYQQSVQTKGADAKVTQDLAIRLNKAQAQLATMENELKKTTAELERQTSMWYKLSQSAQEVGENLKKVGDKIADVGKSLSTKITAPIVGLGTLATKSAIDFESAFAGVRKTVDATEEQFAQLERGIRDMSKEIPASATAIAGVAEAAGQLGIQTENILSFTRVMIDLGEATNLSAEEAASALAQFANITQMSQKEFDRLGTTIVALGNNLATTERDIVNMGQRLAGAGAQIGLTEAQIMSFAAALSSVGIEAEAGGSAFSKVMVEMQLAVETNSKKLQEFASVAGMSTEEFKRAFQEDAAGAILAFIQGLGNAEERGMSAIKILDDMGISEVRLRDTLLRAAGASDVFTEALNLGTQAWEENTALTKEAEQRYKTSESQLAILKNTLNDVAITIGQTIVPIVLDFAERIKALAERFASLSPETQRTILVIAGLAAAIGPVLVVIGKLISIVGTATQVFSTISMSIANAGGIMAAITSPVGIAIAAITGLVAIGMVLYQNWDSISAWLKQTWMNISNAAQNIWNNIKTSITNSINNLKGVLSSIWNSIASSMSSIWCHRRCIIDPGATKRN